MLRDPRPHRGSHGSLAFETLTQFTSTSASGVIEPELHERRIGKLAGTSFSLVEGPWATTLERWRAVQLVQTRGVLIEIDVQSVGEGVLVAHGGQGGGYSAYVEDGRLHVAYNEYGDLHTLDAGPLGAGPHAIELELVVRERLRWDVVVRIDGSETARLEFKVLDDEGDYVAGLRDSLGQNARRRVQERLSDAAAGAALDARGQPR